MNNRERKGSIPFIFGVSGHRDISTDDIDACRDKTRAILEYFLKSYPSTPIIVLSALAEGADRLVADVAIKMRDSGDFRLRIISPLPFDQAVYEQDFEEQSAQEFRELLEQVDEQFTLEPYQWAGFDEGKINRTAGDSAPERKAQYANVGAFIARHANILLALWDGVLLPDKAGGTGQVVQMMLNGDMYWGDKVPERPEFKRRSLIDGGEHGAVIHIPVKRKVGSEGGKTVSLEDQSDGVLGWLARRKLPRGLNWYFAGRLYEDADNEQLLKKIVSYQKAEFVRTLKQIDQFNADAVRITGSEGFSHSANRLMTEDTQLTGPLHENEVRIQRLNEVAALLSRRFQKPMNTAIILSFVSVAMMAVGYDSFGKEVPGIDLLSMGAFLLGALGVGVVAAVLYFRKYKQKQHDYRALAEMLRIMFYLVHCRLNHSIDAFYRSNSRNRTSWIDHARRYLEIPTWKKRDSPDLDDAPGRMSEVKDWWLTEQKLYFAKAVGDDNNRRGLALYVQIYKKIVIGVYAFSVVTLLTLSWLYLVESAEWVRQFWPVTGAMFALLGFVTQWFGVRGYKDDLGRYDDALDMFRRAEYELAHRLSSGDLERAEAVIRETAIHALDENEQWYALHSDKGIL